MTKQETVEEENIPSLEEIMSQSDGIGDDEENALPVDYDSEIDVDLAAAFEEVEGESEEEEPEEPEESEENVPAEEGEEPANETVDEPEPGVEQPTYDTSFLTKEERDVFGSLPGEAKKITAQIASRVRSGAQQWMNSQVQEIQQQYAKINEALSPYADIFKEQPAHEAIASAMEWTTSLDENPVDTVYDIADKYGLDIEIYEGEDVIGRGGRTNGTQPQQVDSYTRELERRLAQQESKWTEFEQKQTQQQQQAFAERMSTGVNAFVAEKNAKGEPAYPFIEEVGQEVGLMAKTIMDNNPGTDLRSALVKSYDMAVWSRPHLREQLLATQVPAPKENTNTNGTRQSSSLRGNSPSGGIDKRKNPETIDDALRLAMGIDG